MGGNEGVNQEDAKKTRATDEDRSNTDEENRQLLLHLFFICHVIRGSFAFFLFEAPTGLRPTGSYGM
jgi:hypothetical protein